MLQQHQFGIIGFGMMGQALMGGMIKAGLITAKQLHAADPFVDFSKIEWAKEANFTRDNIEVLKKADVTILATKPHMLETVVKGINNAKIDMKNKVIISLMAAVSTEQLKTAGLGTDRVIRVMPSTPALAGAGCTAIAEDASLSAKDLELVKAVFSAVGRVWVLPESLFGAFTGVASSSPAYVYMFVEALANAGVRNGLPRNEANQIAAQAVMGSAKMVLDTGLHCAQLRDNVCSPGGTTIAGVESLCNGNFQGTVMNCVNAVITREKEMQKKH